MKSSDVSSLQYYILGTAGEQERLILQQSIIRPHFLAEVQQILQDYGLEQTLQSSESKAQILEVGCGQGLNLLDLAQLLKERNLLDKAALTGLDGDKSAIIEAEKKARSRGYKIDYYLHDLAVPLESNLLLSQDTKLQFDFILGLFIIEHLPNPRQKLERLYSYLKPGGVIYLMDWSYEQGEDGWIAPHPTMRYIAMESTKLAKTIPGWVNSAVVQADWLKEWGAQPVTQQKHLIPANCDTPENLAMLKNYLYIILNAGQVLVQRNLLDKAAMEQTRSTLMRELGPNCYGQMTAYSTIAVKPIDA